jgi:hypothetical protein
MRPVFAMIPVLKDSKCARSIQKEYSLNKQSDLHVAIFIPSANCQRIILIIRLMNSYIMFYQPDKVKLLSSAESDN